MDTKILKTIQLNFLKELQGAYAGKKTSLPFIVHKLSPSPIVKNEEVFQTFVIGGTIAKTATLRKKDTNIEILDSREYQVSFKSEQDFLSFFDYKIRKDISVIALSFAYPLRPIFENGRLDGELLAVPKEGKFTELIGKNIGREIEDYIFKSRKKRITVSAANDTICLLLSGLTKYHPDNLAAGIVGTGLNFAFFLDKISSVNLESANFDKFLQTVIGKIIDQESDQPGKAIFEKETAGAYLYKHFNIIINDRKIDYPLINSTEELNKIGLNRNYSSSEGMHQTVRPEPRSSRGDSSRQDGYQMVTRQARTITYPKVSQIARYLFKKSAQLVACQISGITEFKKHSMIFNMEGSLFWKASGYKKTVAQTVKQLTPEFNVKFIEIKDSGILGAAKLVS